LDFVFHGSIPILGTINTAKGVKVCLVGAKVTFIKEE
jgi:hypothetical protein